MKILRSTDKCIVCLAKAETWTGHVMRGKEIVLAGWCSIHRSRSMSDLRLLKHEGCFGGYHASYGLTGGE